MSLECRLKEIESRMAAAAAEVGRDPSEITLVGASKTQSSETIKYAISKGLTTCGENRVQEFTPHWDANAYEGAKVHFIGHLQTNKVKYIVGKVSVIESVDSFRLLEAVANQAEKLGLVQEILLEVNIAGEESKGGCPVEEVESLARRARELSHVRLRGLMVIPPVEQIKGENRIYFQKTHGLLVDIRRKMGDNDCEMNCLSMGMSDDFEDAIREGATHVRVGRGIFGNRN